MCVSYNNCILGVAWDTHLKEDICYCFTPIKTYHLCCDILLFGFIGSQLLNDLTKMYTFGTNVTMVEYG